MNHAELIQKSLDEIDQNITLNIRPAGLAEKANYSLPQFYRVFLALTGRTVKSYITRRKLEYALYDLSQGKKVVDVAMDYGFETHAGFTKAFKKHFGFPPSLYRMHIAPSLPKSPKLTELKRIGGENIMQVYIEEKQPFTVAGYSSRHQLLGVSSTADIPAFWEKINLDFVAALTTLHDDYSNSHHCEVGLCYDIDEAQGFFTYLLGVGVDAAQQTKPPRQGVDHIQIPGGTYAVFTTPPVNEERYTASIQETWREILEHWLPEHRAQYEYDSSRPAYEYYDERDHAWLHDGKSQMDICIPILKCEK